MLLSPRTYAIACACFLAITMMPWVTDAYWHRIQDAITIGLAAYFALRSVQAALSTEDD